MVKGSSQNNLQKIHTYAQDIEAVRAVKRAVTTAPSPTKPKVPQSIAQKETELATEPMDLLVPQKPKLPAIRTMADDSTKNIPATTHVATPTSALTQQKVVPPDTKPQVGVKLEIPEEEKKPEYKKTPTIHVPIINDLKSKKTNRLEDTQKEITASDKPNNKPTLLVTKPTKKTVEKVAPNKPTRDRTYQATVITDTKYKRFSVWNELKKKISDFFETKTAKKKITYTTTTTPLHKGVVQNATTNTARKTIADYSTLKNRVKTRQPENITDDENDSTTNIASDEATPTKQTDIEKTRFELLTTIEKEVGMKDEKLPKYLSPVYHSNDKNSNTATIPQLQHQEIKNEIPNVIPPYKNITDFSPADERKEITEKIPMLDTSLENSQPTTTCIFPTIPSIPNKIPDIDMTLTTENLSPQAAIPNEIKWTETSQISSPETIKIEDAFSNQATEKDIAIAQYFKQPKIEPILPTTSSTTATATTQTSRQLLNNQTPRHATVLKNRIVYYITQYTQTFILGGLVIASVVVVGVIAATSFIAQSISTSNTVISHHYFNSSAIHPVIINPISPLTITEQISRHNNAIGVSEIILQDIESATLSPVTLSQSLKLPLDPSFNASLLDLRFGWYREEPFIVIKYSGDTVARGALLKWERTMYTDLLPLFTITPVSSSLITVFKDTTIDNIDVRALYLATGEETLVYGIVAPGHLIITTNEMSFLNLSSNFNPLAN